MMKRTLIEHLKYKLEQRDLQKEIELPIENPLSATFQSVIAFDSIGIRHTKIVAMEQWSRHIGGENRWFVDYHLNDGNPDFGKVRVIPNKEGSQLSGQIPDIVLLKKFDSFEFDEGFLTIIEETDDTRIFEIGDEGSKEVFERLNNLRGPWVASVAQVIDKDENGVLTKLDEINKFQVKYWDFERKMDDGSSELLFVEHDLASGWFTLWRGIFPAPEMNIF